MKAVVTNGAVRMCKAPVKSSPPTETDTQLFTGRIPSCRPTNTVRALKAKQHQSIVSCVRVLKGKLRMTVLNKL